MHLVAARVVPIAASPLAMALLFLLPAAADAPFRDVTAESGIGATVWGPTASWGDYNNDGYADILVGCGRLFRNNGPPGFTFTEVAAGLAGAHGAFADVDNDGDLDLYCPAGGNDDHLFLNQGPPGFAFVERTDFDGDGTPDMVDGRVSIAAGWGDFDLDGSVDIYVGSYERHCGGSPTVCADCELNTMWRGLGDGRFQNVSAAWGLEAAEKSMGNLGYCVVNTSRACSRDSDCPAGDFCKSGNCARGVNAGDYDNDGDLDIHVSSYRLDPNMLLRNDGNGQFSNASFSTGLAGNPDGATYGHSLGADWGDMDNDGDLDLYTANLAHWWGIALGGHDTSYLWRNNSAGVNFTNVRGGSGMRVSWNALGQVDCEEGSAGWADADNDGDLDVYVTGFYPFVQHWSTMYRNEGDTDANGVPNFVDISDPGGGVCGTLPDPPNQTVGPTCMKRWYSWMAVWADYDRDGDLDLLTSGNPRFNQCDAVPMPPECGSANPSNRDTWPQPAYLVLFRNETGSSLGHWLELRLVGGNGANRAAIGARLTLTADLDGDGTAEAPQIREVSGGEGYETSQDALLQHFGLKNASIVDRLEIRWPAIAAPLATFTGLAPDTYYVAYRSGADLRRGTSPDALPVLRAAVPLYPARDPVLGDGQTYFYLVDDPLAVIDVSRDMAHGEVVIAVRN